MSEYQVAALRFATLAASRPALARARLQARLLLRRLRLLRCLALLAAAPLMVRRQRCGTQVGAAVARSASPSRAYYWRRRPPPPANAAPAPPALRTKGMCAAAPAAVRPSGGRRRFFATSRAAAPLRFARCARPLRAAAPAARSRGPGPAFSPSGLFGPRRGRPPAIPPGFLARPLVRACALRGRSLAPSALAACPCFAAASLISRPCFVAGAPCRSAWPRLVPPWPSAVAASGPGSSRPGAVSGPLGRFSPALAPGRSFLLACCARCAVAVLSAALGLSSVSPPAPSRPAAPRWVAPGSAEPNGGLASPHAATRHGSPGAFYRGAVSLRFPIVAAAGKDPAGRFPSLPLPLRFFWRKALTKANICAMLK